MWLPRTKPDGFGPAFEGAVSLKASSPEFTIAIREGRPGKSAKPAQTLPDAGGLGPLRPSVFICGSPRAFPMEALAPVPRGQAFAPDRHRVSSLFPPFPPVQKILHPRLSASICGQLPCRLRLAALCSYAAKLSSVAAQPLCVHRCPSVALRPAIRQDHSLSRRSYHGRHGQL